MTPNRRNPAAWRADRASKGSRSAAETSSNHIQIPANSQAKAHRHGHLFDRRGDYESLAVHWGKPIRCGARTIGFICVVEMGFGAFDPYGNLISVHSIEDHARRALVASAAERRMR